MFKNLTEIVSFVGSLTRLRLENPRELFSFNIVDNDIHFYIFTDSLSYKILLDSLNFEVNITPSLANVFRARELGLKLSILSRYTSPNTSRTIFST